MADWSRIEVEATVADYFAMFDLQLRGVPYVKTEHIRHLGSLLSNRSEGAIQYKYGNISAVLDDLGLPFIDGFKPYQNYQQLLFDVVDARVHADKPLLTLIKARAEEPAEAPVVGNILDVLVEPPIPEKPEYPVPPRVKAGGNFHPVDYVALEAQNRSLGKAGEEFALRFERARLQNAGKANLADKVEWVSADRGDWFGFDIKSYERDGTDRFIEVKTTRHGKRTPFFASRNEVSTSMELDERYHLYRTFSFDRDAKLFMLYGRLDRSCRLDPISFEARAG